MSEESPDDGHQQQSPCQSTSQSQSASQTLTQSPQSQTQAGSGSSSGPTSASQTSSGSGTLSSADTIPVSLASVPEEPEPEPQPWGRMLPMVKGFKALNCVQEEYLFGRESKCHYVINDPVLIASQRFRTYSKKHFRIFREGTIVFIEDLSNNGTFVDGVLIGQGKKQPLPNNAVIALAEERDRVFMFIDLMTDEQTSLPKDFQDKYLVTKKIGEGVCGEVKLAFERSSCKKFAVKIIHKKNFPSVGTAKRNTEREIEILQRIDHPCLIKTQDFYQTDDSYFIVLELMEGGELFNRMKCKQLHENLVKLYFYQMLRAVEYLHRNGIIHRDLKPENILLSSQDDICLIKVTDFNQSKILEEASLMRTLCGTPYYLAPEVFTNAATTGYGATVDVWSLGVLLFVCLGGYPPFYEGSGRLSISEQITRGEFIMVPSKWKNISHQAKDMVKKLLVVDPAQRLTIETALQHPWLEDPVMLDQAHRLMDPSPPASDAMQEGVCSFPRRKRSREGEEEEEENPAKRSQTLPTAQE
ncbi:serine/threonine-protein kinase Chk2 isoform X2 [Lampris incognitus]|uniref:serine/threonine-protein kinase Chk2 isoform X2 n=1 Tax=Lampris incognitus TaxID=2546036 RepID=UPI0024B53F3C|nr:serine/threonine-protein kinase Chk2 isoform X2 [Lampris incognitus]